MARRDKWNARTYERGNDVDVELVDLAGVEECGDQPSAALLVSVVEHGFFKHLRDGGPGVGGQVAPIPGAGAGPSPPVVYDANRADYSVVSCSPSSPGGGCAQLVWVNIS